MGGATSEGNEAKSKMRQPSDMHTPRFEHGWSVVQHATPRPRRHPQTIVGDLEYFIVNRYTISRVYLYGHNYIVGMSSSRFVNTAEHITLARANDDDAQSYDFTIKMLSPITTTPAITLGFGSLGLPLHCISIKRHHIIVGKEVVKLSSSNYHSK